MNPMLHEVDSDAARWDAVRTRDASFDGRFVYAVRSTGVYCKPSCPSRPARRENVSFFATGEGARVAGFRACRRCRPDDEAASHAASVRIACESIRSVDKAPSLEALARTAGLSPGHFQRVFKALVGLSPKQYALAERRKRLRSALSTAPSVTQAIYQAGYGASSRAYADASATGMKPALLRNGAKGETIRFSAASSSLGEVLIAATERGLCFVEFGEPAELKAELARRFPGAGIEPADDGFAGMVEEVIQAIDAPHANVSLPLDIRGTSFQERVWRALTAIPLGRTVSYAELAERIGQPTAARAVARACATNSIAVVVPCHRVVRGSGDLSGYKWGVERKRALLDRERAAVEDAS
jgi:AraC family transcriptional regulator of adaptative response/methylated-DNA-[protein]-cysteine methyltransferase